MRTTIVQRICVVNFLFPESWMLKDSGWEGEGHWLCPRGSADFLSPIPVHWVGAQHRVTATQWGSRVSYSTGQMKYSFLLSLMALCRSNSARYRSSGLGWWSFSLTVASCRLRSCRWRYRKRVITATAQRVMSTTAAIKPTRDRMFCEYSKKLWFYSKFAFKNGAGKQHIPPITAESFWVEFVSFFPLLPVSAWSVNKQNKRYGNDIKTHL